MKKVKLNKQSFAMILIAMLSAILNFTNLGLEGYANTYYSAAVKSMTMNLKNFFFVAFDPAGFVAIDKPPLGYWFQAISAKIFGFNSFGLLFPQALAGVLSVIVIYIIVKKSFGTAAGLISALTLAGTPVFVAVSRNNTVDNTLVLFLLLACWALSIAAEKGKLKYLILSMVLVGIGFNIKMLQAYMVAPALYVTYLFSTAASIKRRLVHLAAGTAVLIAVSLSWAVIVDAIPASSRPYVDSSTNNTVMELIVGHNGLERLSLSSSSNGKGAMPNGDGRGQFQGGSPSGMPGNPPSDDGRMPAPDNNSSSADGRQNNQGNAPSFDNNQGIPTGRDGSSMGGNLQGTFGGETAAGLTRLFSKNILSDQIVWFIPLAIFGFIAAAFKEKLGFALNNPRKHALVLWFMWFLPSFIYFSFNTGTFHSYYLTILAPPIAALTGIGITAMWEFYKEGGFKAWCLPAALAVNGVVQLLMQSYFINTSGLVKVLMVLIIILCFGGSAVLVMLNLIKNKAVNTEGIELTLSSKALRLKKIIAGIAFTGLLITPLAGSAAAMFYPLSSSFPAAGLELLSGSSMQGGPQMNAQGSSNSALIDFLLKNKTSNQKYLLVVGSANDASDIIIQTAQPVMAIGGFLGNDNSITLDEFKEMVKKGEVRYVMAGSRGGNGAASEIMNWVTENGKAVSIDGSTSASSTSEASQDKMQDGFGGRSSGQLYDLADVFK